jgi:hypothetical protein
MGSSFSPTVRRSLGAAAAAITCLALAVGLSGCPIAADLENPLRFDALPKPGGTAGAAGTGSVDCVQALPATTDPAIACDYTSFTRTHCARGGCHNAQFKSAGLDMNLDDGLLIARLVDVPARHGSITCSGTTETCIPGAATCDNCSACVANDLLINKTTFADSWMVKKIDAFNVDNVQEVVQMQCGTAMPYMPGNTGFTAERRDCLKKFFEWIAVNGRKCDVSTPAGGSGGGGAGGSGGAPTAGTGGT